MKDASNMTRALYADQYANQIQEAAARSTDPMAKARAQQAIGQIKAQYAPMLMETAQRQALLQQAQKGNVSAAQLVPHFVPKEHQAAALKEVAQSENAASNEKAIMDAFDQAAKDNTLMRTGAGLRTPASILKMRALMLPIIHDNEGRVNEFEQKTTSDLEPGKGDFDSKIAYKRKAMLDFIHGKQATPTLDAYRIPTKKASAFTKRGN